MGTVLVTGATGVLGREVVRLLVARGVAVRGLSRRVRSGGAGVEWVVGDLVTGEGVAGAVAGVEVVVDCATTVGRKDVAAVRTLVAEAGRAGVRHLLYVSIVGVDRVPIPYYRAKLACERVVRESGLGWTVLRATQFHDLLLRIFDVSARLPVFPVPGGAWVQPVDVREVAARVAELVGEGPAGYAPEVGGRGCGRTGSWPRPTCGRRVGVGCCCRCGCRGPRGGRCGRAGTSPRSGRWAGGPSRRCWRSGSATADVNQG